jgi:hypothetical protein
MLDGFMRFIIDLISDLYLWFLGVINSSSAITICLCALGTILVPAILLYIFMVRGKREDPPNQTTVVIQNNFGTILLVLFVLVVVVATLVLWMVRQTQPS